MTLYDQIPINGVYYEVTGIDKDAFKNVSGEIKLSVPTSLCDANKGLKAALSKDNSSAENVKSIHLTLTASDNDTEVPSQAFQNIKSITSVTFGEGVTSIKELAFKSCTNLTTISWGDVTSIENQAFANCGALTSLEISGKIKKIGDRAFTDCRGLTSLKLGEGVKDVGEYAFNLGNITKLELPSTLESIGNGAFQGCSSNVYISYNGSEAEWGKVTKGERVWAGKPGTEYDVHCTEQ